MRIATRPPANRLLEYAQIASPAADFTEAAGTLTAIPGLHFTIVHDADDGPFSVIFETPFAYNTTTGNVQFALYRSGTLLKSGILGRDLSANQGNGFVLQQPVELLPDGTYHYEVRMARLTAGTAVLGTSLSGPSSIRAERYVA